MLDNASFNPSTVRLLYSAHHRDIADASRRLRALYGGTKQVLSLSCYELEARCCRSTVVESSMSAPQPQPCGCSPRKSYVPHTKQAVLQPRLASRCKSDSRNIVAKTPRLVPSRSGRSLTRADSGVRTVRSRVPPLSNNFTRTLRSEKPTHLETFFTPLLDPDIVGNIHPDPDLLNPSKPTFQPHLAERQLCPLPSPSPHSWPLQAS